MLILASGVVPTRVIDNFLFITVMSFTYIPSTPQQIILGWAGIVTVAVAVVMIALLFTDSVFHFLIGLFSFLILADSSTWLLPPRWGLSGPREDPLAFLPLKFFSGGSIGFVLPAYQSVMGGTCTPKFLSHVRYHSASFRYLTWVRFGSDM